jgi:hypothetical protein
VGSSASKGVIFVAWVKREVVRHDEEHGLSSVRAIFGRNNAYVEVKGQREALEEIKLWPDGTRHAWLSSDITRDDLVALYITRSWFGGVDDAMAPLMGELRRVASIAKAQAQGG